MIRRSEDKGGIKMPVNFNGHLGANEIFAAIYNMIISQEVFFYIISGTGSTLVDMSRVDGGLWRPEAVLCNRRAEVLRLDE